MFDKPKTLSDYFARWLDQRLGERDAKRQLVWLVRQRVAFQEKHAAFQGGHPCGDLYVPGYGQAGAWDFADFLSQIDRRIDALRVPA